MDLRILDKPKLGFPKRPVITPALKKWDGRSYIRPRIAASAVGACRNVFRTTQRSVPQKEWVFIVSTGVPADVAGGRWSLAHPGELRI